MNSKVEPAEDGITVDGRLVLTYHEQGIDTLPWGTIGVDLVIDSTGRFKDAQDLGKHIENGAKKVLISAPAKNEDITIVIGVNDDKYDGKIHNIVSNASCTTNCLAPFAKVLNNTFGIKRGFMNTIHSYTLDQRILDRSHSDLRRARAAALSQIPTSTGAAKAIGLVIPELKGKLDGMSTRVPTPDGSMVDLVVELERDTTAEEINEAMLKASEGDLAGILEYTEDPIVSADVVGNISSSIYDGLLTSVLGGTGNFAKCIAWYDNEMGYSHRCKDLAKLMLP
jgi:glyceraldehyde 3-phosphate dehydrogenase